jgi:hypothetical protein
MNIKPMTYAKWQKPLVGNIFQVAVRLFILVDEPGHISVMSHDGVRFPVEGKVFSLSNPYLL